MSDTGVELKLEAGQTRVGAGTLAVFTATIFLSAFLLFSIQPMFAKLVLPKLGGSAAVWSVAMVFFQAMLLAGYAFAHLLTSRLSPKVAVVAHLTVLAGCMTVLPVALPTDWGAPPESGTAFWLMGLFAAAVGLPFFAVAVNGPLLQAWFARTGHPHAGDPYFLYGASNIGSFAALIAYPIVIETQLGGHAQTVVWTAGFALLALLIAVCGLPLIRGGGSVDGWAVRAPASAEPAPSLALRSGWVALAFVPSALLVAVTGHITTDVAAMPFLWVVPLALFLLTFVLTFRREPWPSQATMLVVQPVAVAVLLITGVIAPLLPLPIIIGVHLAVFFVNAMVCHGELVRLRPGAARLTDFYLMMSLGGVLGGVFASLVAPTLFSTVLEYPILIVAALLCRPGIRAGGRKAIRLDLILVAGLAVLFVSPAAAGVTGAGLSRGTFVLLVTICAAATILLRSADRRFTGMTALLLAGIALYDPFFAKSDALRSFYGVHRIVESPDGQHRLLLHGTTMHGATQIKNADGSDFVGRPTQITYYWPGSGIGQGVAAVREAHGGRLGAVAVIGLGTGSLACVGEPGEDWRFFEIDPVVVDIARDASRFRFLSECTPDAPISLGDARLTLAAGSEPRFDLIVVDAFSSDAIPAHLLTREAMRLYLASTTQSGAILFHVSNRHMELTSVVAAVAAVEGLVTYAAKVPAPDGGEPMRLPTQVVMVARSEADLAPLAARPDFKRVTAKPEVTAWTDDFSNLLGAIFRNYSGLPGYRMSGE